MSASCSSARLHLTRSGRPAPKIKARGQPTPETSRPSVHHYSMNRATLARVIVAFSTRRMRRASLSGVGALGGSPRATKVSSEITRKPKWTSAHKPIRPRRSRSVPDRWRRVYESPPGCQGAVCDRGRQEARSRSGAAAMTWFSGSLSRRRWRSPQRWSTRRSCDWTSSASGSRCIARRLGRFSSQCRCASGRPGSHATVRTAAVASRQARRESCLAPAGRLEVSPR